MSTAYIERINGRYEAFWYCNNKPRLIAFDYDDYVALIRKVKGQGFDKVVDMCADYRKAARTEAWLDAYFGKDEK